MFEKVLMPEQRLILHAWGTRLMTSTEDSGSLLSPIVLRSLPEADTTLQQAIRQWHRQESFLHALRAQSPFVRIQLERYLALNVRHDHAVTWDHNHILIPVFDDLGHCSVIWHEFQVIVGILYKGFIPTEGHNQAVLVNSSSDLRCNDNRPLDRFVRDQTFYEEIYMLWLAPWSATRMEFRRPLPLISQAPQNTALATLMSKHFA